MSVKDLKGVLDNILLEMQILGKETRRTRRVISVVNIVNIATLITIIFLIIKTGG